MDAEVAEPIPYPQHRIYDSAEDSPYPMGMIQRSFAVLNDMLSKTVFFNWRLPGYGGLQYQSFTPINYTCVFAFSMRQVKAIVYSAQRMVLFGVMMSIRATTIRSSARR